MGYLILNNFVILLFISFYLTPALSDQGEGVIAFKTLINLQILLVFLMFLLLRSELGKGHAFVKKLWRCKQQDEVKTKAVQICTAFVIYSSDFSDYALL